MATFIVPTEKEDIKKQIKNLQEALKEYQ